MRIVETGLVPVYEDESSPERLINARELHEFVQSKRQFANWIQDRIATYGLNEGEDFLTQPLKSTGGRPGTDYYLTLDAAKELAMVENNEQGRKVRRYFIEVEKRARQQYKQIPQGFAAALRLAADQAEQLEAQGKQLQIMAPKAEVYDAIADATNLQTVQEVAKVYGIGPNKLFGWMRSHEILMWDNLPYQQFIDAGYFQPREREWTNEATGEQQISVRTMMTGAGILWLKKRITDAGDWDKLRDNPRRVKMVVPLPQVVSDQKQATFGI